MSEPSGTKETTPVPDGKSEAQIFLETEFAECRSSLQSWREGTERMREGHSSFDQVWSEVVRNAGRMFGKTATRDALENMGRMEDVGYLY